MSMKLDELTHGVPKGSQKRYKHPMATDDPKKYVGKWEAYDTPQGLSRVKKKKVKESLTSPVPYQWVEQSEKGWYAKFQSGTEKFFVAFAPTISNPKLWGIMWDTEWFGVKNSAQEVFATILAVIRDFFSKKRPDLIEFKPNNGKLMRVYKAMSKALEPELKKLGYEMDYRKPGFGLIRKVVSETRLDELMDRPGKYVWDEPRQDGHVETASFESNGVKYVAFFTLKNYMSYELNDAENFKSIRNKRKVWELEFDRVGWEPFVSTREALKKKPKGKALEVLSTVAAIIGEFLRKKNPDQLYFSTTSPGLKVAYQGMGRILQPKLHSLGYELDWREPLKGQLVGYIERRSAMLPEDTDVSYVTRRAPTQNAIGAEELYPTDVVAQRKSKKAPLKTVRQSVKALGGKLPRLDETIRKPQFGIMNTDYEVQDEAGNVIGVCEIHDNVIEKLMTKTTDEEYLGKILRNLLSVLVREADRIKAPLRMQLQPGSRDDLKRFLERFGFRHVGDNIMKRVEGSVTPPSVIMATGINGSDEA